MWTGKCIEHVTLSHMSVVPHCHSWCFCRKLVSRQACLFIIKAVTPLTAVLSAWRFLFRHKFCIPPSPMIYQRSSLFIQNASLNHLPLASFYLWSHLPAELKLHILSAECVLLTLSPLSVKPISLVSLITMSQPSKHRYQTFVAIEILFPFPKALCPTYKVQPRRVVHGGGGLLPWRIYIKRLTQRNRLMTFVAGCDEERVTWCDEAVAGEPQSRTAHYMK